MFDKESGLIGDMAYTLVNYSYLIIAIILLLVSMSFLVLWCCERRSDRMSKGPESTKSDYVVRKDRVGFRIQMLLLLSAFYFFYVGMEVTYGGLIVKFAMKYMGWTQQKGTYLNSCFWGSFAVGRLLAIFLARCISSFAMVTADLTLATAALVGLVAVLKNDGVNVCHYNKFSGDKVCFEELILWFCTSMFGLGMASIFPAGISWAERYIQITGKAAAVFVVGSALGEMVMPLITGALFDAKTPMWMMYVLMGGATVSLLLYIVMQNLACSVGERYEKLATVSEDLRPLRDDVDDDETTEFIAGSAAESQNGDGWTAGKKHVTFDLKNNPSRLAAKENSGKLSILKSKSLEKKD